MINIRLTLFLWVFFFFSCAGNKPSSVFDENGPLVFPAPPDTARVQYLTSISTSNDIAGKPSFITEYILGDEAEKPVNKPYGVTVTKGKIYICDTMLPGLEIINLVKNTFEYFTPSGLGQLKKPINCCLDENGQIYIADAGRRQVVVFDNLGKYVTSIGGSDQGKPTDVSIYDNKLWVCDVAAHQIVVYSIPDFNEINRFPETTQNRPQYLFSPTNISIRHGKVYVSDTGDARIKIFSTIGEFKGVTGGSGKKHGQFVRPKGIDVDSQGRFYVVDAAFENVQIFDDTGQLLMFFGGHGDSPGYMWLPAGIHLDESNLDYFNKYVYEGFELEYLIFLTNQYGPTKLNVYGFIK